MLPRSTASRRLKMRALPVLVPGVVAPGCWCQGGGAPVWATSLLPVCWVQHGEVRVINRAVVHAAVREIVCVVVVLCPRRAVPVTPGTAVISLDLC